MIRRRLAKLNEIFQDFNETRQSEGIFPASTQILAVIWNQIFFRGDAILFARSVEEPPDRTEIKPGFTLRELQPQDLTLFVPAVEESAVEWYRLLLRKGRSCLLMLMDDQLAAYLWMGPENDPQLERIYVPLSPGDLCLIEARTIPAFRRQGLQKAIFNYVIEWARERGYSRIISPVGAYNDASISLHHKLGYKPISRMTRTKILMLVHFNYKPNIFGKAGSFWMPYG
jgi:GNAT superfamily N-acetyltransferase